MKSCMIPFLATLFLNEYYTFFEPFFINKRYIFEISSNISISFHIKRNHMIEFTVSVREVG